MRLRPRYADVAATAALVLSMGGTAYAATVITSADIKDGTVQSRDVRDDNLLSRDVRNGTLTLADINDVAEEALRGQTGPQGPQGEPGADGADGAPGVSGYVDVAGEWVNGVVGETLTARAVCPSGKKPLSGGFEAATGSMAFSPAHSHHVTFSPGWDPAFPDGAEMWEVRGHAVFNGVSGVAWSLRAWVTCAHVS